MAWFDAADVRVEGPCDDLGSLLRSLEPVPECIPNGFMVPLPALQITATSREIRMSIHSDIWFPWVMGSAHPSCDYERWFDNRELSGRHTPRLNAFLAEVAREAGESFGLDPEEVSNFAARWVSDGGVRMDVGVDRVMPVEELDAEWF